MPQVELAAWVPSAMAVLEGRSEAGVPCGSCTACCEASQFIPIGPDETATLAAVPKALTVPAPGRPKGHVVLGYDERGRCPMLGSGGCTIYSVRPRACRAYDCRTVAAVGAELPPAAPVWSFDGDLSLLDELRAFVNQQRAQSEARSPDRVAPPVRRSRRRRGAGSR